jgi:hypothetical protein
MEQMVEMLAGDAGLRHMMMFATYGRDRVSYARQRNAPLVGALVERAQAAGQVRPDLRPTDIPFIIFTLAEATQFARTVSPEIWRRYLNIILDGLRPERAGVTPLPVPALLPEELENTMRQNAPRHPYVSDKGIEPCPGGVLHVHAQSVDHAPFISALSALCVIIHNFLYPPPLTAAAGRLGYG